MNGKIGSLNQSPVQDVKEDSIILIRRKSKMQPNNSLSSKDTSGEGSLLIIEADHNLAEKNLFEVTKIHKPNGG